MALDLPFLRGCAARGRTGLEVEERAFRPLMLLAMWRRSIALFYRMDPDLSGEKKRRTKFNRPIKNRASPFRFALSGKSDRVRRLCAEWSTGANDGGSIRSHALCRG